MQPKRLRTRKGYSAWFERHPPLMLTFGRNAQKGQSGTSEFLSARHAVSRCILIEAILNGC